MKIDAKTAEKIVAKIAVRTAITIAAVPAMATMTDRTTKGVPGTDSVATVKIANHDNL